MSVREWFAGAGDDVLTYDQVMARLPPPLPRDDAAARAYAAADVDAGAPPRVWAGAGAEACSPCRAPHAEAVDLGSPAPSPASESSRRARAPRGRHGAHARIVGCPARRRFPHRPAPSPASMRALQAEIERRERGARSRQARPTRPGARRIFGDVKNGVA